MSGMKREFSEISEKTEASNKKSTTEWEVKVEIRIYGDKNDDKEDDSDDGSVDDTAAEYMNCEDDATENLSFENLGLEREYGCTRGGNARILLNDQKIGSIYYTLINRDMIGGNLSFWEVCDAESGELEQIAAYFFQTDGSLKKEFLRRMEDKTKEGMANIGCFMYINRIQMEDPYGPHCSQENVRVASKAISLLVDSMAFKADGVTVTLVMYIPNGLNEEGRTHSAQREALDQRQFDQAGFKIFADEDGKCNYMFYETFAY